MEEQKEEGKAVPDDENGGESRTVQAWLAGIAIGCLVLAAMIASFEIGKNNADIPSVVKAPGPGTEKPASAPAPAGPGKDLFVANCGSCHTLSEAGTSGAVGPNLDDLQPDAALVTSAIANGGAGSGAMPAGIVSGEQEKQIADYVSSSAGAGQ